MKIEFVYCQILFSHVRTFGGKDMLLDNIVSGPTALPNNAVTKQCVERGWLKIISKPFLAEPAYDPTLDENDQLNEAADQRPDHGTKPTDRKRVRQRDARAGGKAQKAPRKAAKTG